jgi:hypothetical protein
MIAVFLHSLSASTWVKLESYYRELFFKKELVEGKIDLSTGIGNGNTIFIFHRD